MEVHVCDVNDRVGLASRNTLVAQKKEHVIELNGMSNGVTHMVSKIIEEAGDSTIGRLAIWGHGGPGSVGISRGHREDNRQRSGETAKEEDEKYAPEALERSQLGCRRRAPRVQHRERSTRSGVAHGSGEYLGGAGSGREC